MIRQTIVGLRNIVGLSVLLFLCAPVAPAVELSGFMAGEGRLFLQSPLSDVQHGTEGFSLIVEPELYHEWANGDMSITAAPYLRLDQHDSKRTHGDVRELFWQMISDSWELRIGVNKVFWGVTESQHLVDIVNQTDLVESIDGEEKLGQPMVNFTWIRDWGTLDFFALPFFRERTFPGEEGRLRFPLVVDGEKTTYESTAEANHVDWAVRWSHTLGNFDIGLSHFYGTSREPMLLPVNSGDGEPVLAPHYDLIHQTGVDVQMTVGGWLLKLEAINRSGQGERFVASTGGFEYTFGDVLASGADVGLVVEYLIDERGDDAPTPFEDDLFAGVRLALNDVQSTDLLMGGIVDRDTGASSLGLEATRRVRENWKVALEARFIVGTDETNSLHGLRKDNHVQFQVGRYF